MEADLSAHGRKTFTQGESRGSCGIRGARTVAESPDACFKILGKTVAVKPWFGSVVVAYVENPEDIGEGAAIIACDDQHIVLGVHSYGHTSIEFGGDIVGALVAGIYAHYGRRRYHGLDIPDIRNGIIADYNAGVIACAGAFNPERGRESVRHVRELLYNP